MGIIKNVFMRKAKWLVAGFLLMMCFFFGIALLLPSKVTVSKSVIINAPPLAVSGKLRILINGRTGILLYGTKKYL